jgi:hypothetical protein
MIDHVMGRPSVQFRKIQVLAVVSFWSIYLFRYVCSHNSNGKANPTSEAIAMGRLSFVASLRFCLGSLPCGNRSLSR